jgi:hypothetical protein
VDDCKNLPDHETLTPLIHNTPKPDSGNLQKRSCSIAAAGGKARLVMTAAAKTDRDGHHVVQREMTLWIPAVDGFLKELGFAW